MGAPTVHRGHRGPKRDALTFPGVAVHTVAAPKAVMTKADLVCILTILESIARREPLYLGAQADAERIANLIKAQVLK